MLLGLPRELLADARAGGLDHGAVGPLLGRDLKRALVARQRMVEMLEAVRRVARRESTIPTVNVFMIHLISAAARHQQERGGMAIR